jgi:Calcineurin-like phosphoesterase superfamily domain
VKLGLLTDIHEDVGRLRAALAQFRRAEVEQVVLLGDIFETGPRLDAAVALLRAARAVGAWGNHDFGLCADPSPFIRGRFAPATLEFMGTLRPRLEVDGCLFMHIEPWLDPTDIHQLWHVEPEPLSPALIARSFAAVPHRAIFLGHYHRWFAATPAGRLPWDGLSTLRLPADQRCLVIVNGVCEGFCATFDTTTDVLVPYPLRADEEPADPHASG